MSFQYGFDPTYDAVFGVLGAVQGILGFWSLIGIAFYVLYSLGLFTMAKRRGIRCYGLAWVPVANLWILGSISDQYKYVTAGKNQKRRGILLALSIVMAVLAAALIGYVIQMLIGFAGGYSNISTDIQVMRAVGGMLILWFLMLVVSVTLAVFEYIALYNLYYSAMPENATLFLVLSILFGVTMPFFVFACRNKDGGMPQRYAPAPEAQPVYMPAAPAQAAPVETPAAPAAPEAPAEPETSAAPEAPQNPEEN